MLQDHNYCLKIHITGRSNKYVNITFLSENNILCSFLDQQEGQSTCNVTYGPCQQVPTEIARGTTSNIAIDPQILSEYCYMINASNGTFTVLIEGQIMTSTGEF